jgi:aspartate/methionine/tyrosine aminotransferase
MTLPDRVLSVDMPPIDALNARMGELEAQGHDVISLGQSVPYFGPPQAMLDRVSEALTSDPRLHVYSPDMGIAELRAALSRKLATFNGITADPENQIMVTPGSNQAFMVTMLTMLDPGDEVAIVAPYYFNHHMAIELSGGRVVQIPLSERDGFQLHLSDVQAAVTDRTKAVVITSPNNPTGAVYDSSQVERIARFTGERGMYLISDEAYEFFCYDGARSTSPASVADVGDHVVTLGSFSKTFGMTGWRVGYIVASARFCAQAVKVQDAMAICAPVISQIGAAAALGDIHDFTRGHIPELEARRGMLSEALAAIPALSWHRTAGSLFAFARADSPAKAGELAWDILERAHVLLVPGSAFGREWRDYLRISYGSSTRSRFAEALERLRRYFHSSPGG